MLGAGGNPHITEPCQQCGNAALRVNHAKTLFDQLSQIATPPPHHPVALRIGAGGDDFIKLSLLRLTQPRSAAWRCGIEQAVRSMLVETVDP